MSAGFVYLLRAENGLHKIGRSGRPADRIKDLAASSAVEVELVHQVKTDDMEWLEGKLHHLYAGGRVRGEWFHLTEEELSALKARGCTENFPTAEECATAAAEDFGVILAANVRRLRSKMGFSQQTLAKVARLSLSIVAQVERGRVKDPRYSTLRAIAGVFGVKVKDLTGEG